MLIAAVMLPFVANSYWLSAILIPWLVLSLVALGQNILMGYAGQLRSDRPASWLSARSPATI